MQVRTGTTRVVIITIGLAFKFPKPGNWENFLRGFLANIHETRFSALGHPLLARVKFHIPGGLMVVMPAAKQEGVDVGAWERVVDGNPNSEMIRNIVEPKASSLGVIDGRLQAIDYGS